MSRQVRFASLEALAQWAQRPTGQARPPLPSEDWEQHRLLEWCYESEGQYPALRLLYAIPNGGYRLKREAARLVALGVVPGMPDLHLPVGRRGAHSLYIEMKAQDGRISDTQLERAQCLAQAGNVVAFCFGWQQAAQTLAWYLHPRETRASKE